MKIQWVLLATLCKMAIVTSPSTSLAKTLRVYWETNGVSPYDVHASADIHSTFNQAIRGQLIKSAPGFQLEPGLFDRFEYNFENKYYSLKLKDNLYFHNGRKVTSKDLEFSLTRGFYSKDRNFFSTYLGNIKGINQLKKNSKFKTGNVEGIKIIDELTLHVKLESSNPAFLHSLSNPYFSLIPIEEMKEDYLSWKSTPIGAGQYKVVYNFDGQKTEIELVKKSKNKNCPDKVIFYSILPQNLDSIDISRKYIWEKTKSNIKEYFSERPVAVRLIEFSNQNELSKNENFKNMVKFLVNKNEFLSRPLGITPANQILPQHFWGRTNEDETDYNIGKAKKFLSSIPKKLIPNNEVSAIIFAGSNLSETQSFISELLKKQFKKIGLKLNVVTNNEKFVSEKTSQKYPIRLVGMVVDYIDPLVMFSGLRQNGHNLNYRPDSFIGKEFDLLYKKASEASSYDERLHTVKKLSEFTLNNSVVEALSEEKIKYYVNQNNISDLGQQNQPLTLIIQNIKVKNAN